MNKKELHALFERIAQETMGIQTLQPEHDQQKDYRYVSVWAIRDALQAAFDAGEQRGRSVRKAQLPRPGSKLAKMIQMLQEPQGASVEQLQAMSGWIKSAVTGTVGSLGSKFGYEVTREFDGDGTPVYRIVGQR